MQCSPPSTASLETSPLAWRAAARALLPPSVCSGRPPCRTAREDQCDRPTPDPFSPELKAMKWQSPQISDPEQRQPVASRPFTWKTDNT